MSTSLRRSGARTPSALASTALALLLGVTLAGCGEDDPADTAGDPQETSSPSDTPTDTPTETPTDEAPSEATGESIPVTGNAGVTEAAMVSATDVGGTASTLAFLLDTELARADFASQFERDFGATVLSELDSQQTTAGSLPYGAVVAVGCDAPESVQIDAGEAGLEVTPQLPKETVQCFAPMTFVVLFTAPPAA